MFFCFFAEFSRALIEEEILQEEILLKQAENEEETKENEEKSEEKQAKPQETQNLQPDLNESFEILKRTSRKIKTIYMKSKKLI